MIVREFRQFIPSGFMKRLITLLLAIVVLAHSVAGCCCHHAHAAESDAPATCCSHEHRHEHENSDDGTDSRPNDGDPGDGNSPAQSCDEGSCVFMRSGQSPSVELTLALALDCCLVDVNEVGLDQLPDTLADYPDSQDLAPHTRLHLQLQILLI
jgi:hypothetical protein